MNILILIPYAPNYQPFFVKLGSYLSDGNSVFFATESLLGNYVHPEFKIDQKQLYVFSQFKSNIAEREIIKRKYGRINHWKMFFPDLERIQIYKLRTNNSFWYTQRFLDLFLFFEKIVSENRIDKIVFENISSHFSFVALEVCRQFNIKYCGIISSRFPGRFELHNNEFGIGSAVSLNYYSLENGKIEIGPDLKKNITEYISNISNIVPDYMQFDSMEMSNPLFSYLRKTKILFKDSYRKLRFIIFEHSHNYPYQLGNPLKLSLNLFLRNLNRYFRSFFVKRFFDDSSETDSFFLYPLHFHPESSTSVLARHYTDEYNNIMNICQNIPINSLLYVKDHISSFSFEKIEFYRKISNIPNVKLIRPEVNSKVLIAKSICVITVTSTVGYEALILNKKVVVFGNVFYDFHPNCIKMKTWDELFNILLVIMDNPNFPKADSSFNFVAAYFLATEPGVLNINDISDRNLIENVGRAILSDKYE